MEGQPAVASSKKKYNINLKPNRVLSLVSHIMESTQSHNVESVGTKLCCL
jgi:hypothetical protein